MYMLESVGFMYMCIRVRADGSAVCAHAVAGWCCQLCSALHTLSSGSSLHATAQSIYRRMRVYIDHRLCTHHRWGHAVHTCAWPRRPVRASARARV